ncbi:MAG: hypothetical protein U9R38_05955 [Candidatus Margulisiibacteriota bacterium]|nr:hypothetical protein [Candidatus Margulisiibacteriota bacterium]
MKNIFKAITQQEMARQARIVEIATLAVFAILVGVVIWLWQFKIELTQPGPDGGRMVIEQINVFELLLSKK